MSIMMTFLVFDDTINKFCLMFSIEKLGLQNNSLQLQL